MTNKRDKILLLLAQGLSYGEIARLTGAAKSTISYHAKKLAVTRPHTPKADLDWGEVQSFYNEGYNVKEVAKKFKTSTDRLTQAAKDGSFVLRERSRPLEKILVKNSNYSRGSLKRRLLSSGVIKNQCALCHLSGEWRGKTLVLVLDHINGVYNDNRLENLRLLCPNCNSQTETFTGRNKKYK